MIQTTEYGITAPNKQQNRNNGQEQPSLALVRGEVVTALPKDLYIPPDALEVFLDTFEGPLDLLLYLIKRQNLDILDIPIAKITRQYMEYVELMKEVRLELAGDYLVMAAMLAEIKSRLLLPRSSPVDEDEEDPRAELIRRLQEYERYKQAAEDIDALPRIGRDLFETVIQFPDRNTTRPDPEISLDEILNAFSEVLKRADMYTHHEIEREQLSVRERMSQVLAAVNTESFTEFTSLFPCSEGRAGVVVTLIAILELLKNGLLEMSQTEPYGPLYVKSMESMHEPESSG